MMACRDVRLINEATGTSGHYWLHMWPHNACSAGGSEPNILSICMISNRLKDGPHPIMGYRMAHNFVNGLPIPRAGAHGTHFCEICRWIRRTGSNQAGRDTGKDLHSKNMASG